MTELIYLKQKLGIQKPEDWYRVKGSDFRENDGGTLLYLYKESCYKVLENLYPELNLQPWKFAKNDWSKDFNKPFFAYLNGNLGRELEREERKILFLTFKILQFGKIWPKSKNLMVKNNSMKYI
jgi:hypothetical protein